MHRFAVPLCALLLVSGCAHLREPKRTAVGTWIDESPTGPPDLQVAGIERLGELERSGPAGRVIRLDRLLDLYDAARFTQDQDARETLWLVLGGSSSTRGPAASREAVLRMLDEAYALDEIADSLDEDQRRFVADAIALLSADLFLPDSAESLIDQTLGYRMLAESGHPRIADNARFRLFDFIRGVFAGALEVGPGPRNDVVVHALYAEREDISAWLDDAAPHARPPLPTAKQVIDLMHAQLVELAKIPRWEPVATNLLHEGTGDLSATLTDLLPSPREGWKLTELPRGTAEAESLAPVVLLERGAKQVLQPGSPHAVTLTPDSDKPAGAIAGELERDGRGVLLLVAEPELPAPEFAAGLALLTAARVSTIELAVHEPRTGDNPGMAVLALPLHVVHADELSPGARAIREARIQVRLSGHGVRFAIDDRWLLASPALPSDLRSLVARLHEAFPRERVIRLSLDADVQPQQLIELMAALVGGRSAAFVAVGWAADQPLVALPEKLDDTADKTLALRATLALPRTPSLEIPVELAEIDRGMLGELAKDLGTCVPELERAMPKGGLTITLGFAEGKVTNVALRGKGVTKDRLAAIERCVDERTVGRRLREHTDPLSIVVRFD